MHQGLNNEEFKGLKSTKKLGMINVELNVDSMVIIKMLESGTSMNINEHFLIKQIHQIIECHDEVVLQFLLRGF